MVVGASPYPHRYSYQAIRTLQHAGHQTFGLGKQKGEVHGVSIHTNPQPLEEEEIDTITVYLNPRNQEGMLDWVLRLEPKRVIFNPGAENPPLEQSLQAEGIETLRACTLVMLHTGQY